MKCKWCKSKMQGNKKKQFCSDGCRINSHRKSKWKPMTQLTDEEWEIIIRKRNEQ